MTAIDFIDLMPICILALTTAILIFSISLKRNHLVVFFLSLFGLLLSFLSTFFIIPNIDILDLIKFDEFNISCIRIVLISSIIISFMIYEAFKKNIKKPEEMYLLFLFSLIGSLVMLISKHLIVFFLGLELLSIPLYAMIAYNYKEGFFLEASIKYMVLSSISACVILLGIAFFYSQTKTLIITNYYHDKNNIILIGITLILLGLSFKLSLVPMHLWAMDVFSKVNAFVLAYLSVISKGAVLAFLFSFINSINFYDEIFLLLAVLAALSMTIGYLMAIGQNDLKKIFALSSVANMGFAIAITLINKEDAKSVFLIFFISYLISALLFCVILSSMEKQNLENLNLDKLSSFFNENPNLSLGMALSLFSFMGAPLTIGLIGKGAILMALIKNEFYFLLGLIILGSALGIYAYLKIIISLFGKINLQNISFPKNQKITVTNILAMLLSLLILLAGFWPNLIYLVLV